MQHIELQETETSTPTGDQHDGYTISQANSAEDIAAIASLFTAYTDSLNLDLTFQNYATELASLPGAYSPPQGALLLVKDHQGSPLGCMGVRSLPYGNSSGRECEAKRLYVNPAGRGRGVGRALVEAGIRAAVQAGYEEMKLDTLSTMKAAQALYKQFNFLETGPYYHNPVEGTVYMSCDLRKAVTKLRKPS